MSPNSAHTTGNRAHTTGNRAHTTGNREHTTGRSCKFLTNKDKKKLIELVRSKKYTDKEIAKIFGINERTVRRHAKDNNPTEEERNEIERKDTLNSKLNSIIHDNMVDFVKEKNEPIYRNILIAKAKEFYALSGKEIIDDEKIFTWWSMEFILKYKEKYPQLQFITEERYRINQTSRRKLSK